MSCLRLPHSRRLSLSAPSIYPTSFIQFEGANCATVVELRGDRIYRLLDYPIGRLVKTPRSGRRRRRRRARTAGQGATIRALPFLHLGVAALSLRRLLAYLAAAVTSQTSRPMSGSFSSEATER